MSFRCAVDLVGRGFLELPFIILRHVTKQDAASKGKNRYYNERVTPAGVCLLLQKNAVGFL